MRRYLTAAIAGAIVLGLATQAHSVLFTFDDPAELDQWDALTEWFDPVWTVDEGVLTVSGHPFGQPTTVRVVRDLELDEGSISFRFRVVGLDGEVPQWRFAQVGAVFRLRPDPSPDGYPGQYVYLDTLDRSAWWQNRSEWATDRICCGGRRVPLDNWAAPIADEWMEMRIEFDSVGWHEVPVDLGGGLERVIGIEEMSEAGVKPSDGKAFLPIENVIEAGDPMFGVGGVGIYVHMNRPGDDVRVQIDDFEVGGGPPIVTGVSATGHLAATWAQLKRT